MPSKSTRMTSFALIPLITFAAVLSLTGCGRKAEQDKPGKLGKDAGKVLEQAAVPLYPQSRFIEDHTESEEYLRPTPTGLNPEIIKTTEVWIAAPGTFDEARLFYQNLYPNVITERKDGERTVFAQLSNVGNLLKASEDKTSPVVLVDVRDSSLTEGERAAYRNELEALKADKARDSVADRRLAQLEQILQEKPLVKITVREVSDKPKQS